MGLSQNLHLFNVNLFYEDLLSSKSKMPAAKPSCFNSVLSSNSQVGLSKRQLGDSFQSEEACELFITFSVKNAIANAKQAGEQYPQKTVLKLHHTSKRKHN